MANFPRTESDVYVLSQKVKAGLESSSEIFPAPPVAPADMDQLLEALNTAQAAVNTARAAAEAATEAKLAAMEALAAATKKNIRYAENTVDFEDEKLKLIGWAARRPKTKPDLPGQPLGLVARHCPDGGVELCWDSPVNGSKPLCYRVDRQARGQTKWEIVATSVEKSIVIEAQPQNISTQWQVVAINRAGQSMPSNVAVS
ncbi:MAG: hypothetical protein A2Y12_19660 [Planctomycetes bacterium GWF2_42_9]|nr:MAG: hypothetical protein A2Y12_19660 [Planctomycetes bacterium GWF2_42_9]